MKNSLIRKLYFNCLILCFWTPRTDGACTLPFVGEESYISASIGEFGANSTHLINYPIQLPIPEASFSFECQEQREDRYVLKYVTYYNFTRDVSSRTDDDDTFGTTDPYIQMYQKQTAVEEPSIFGSTTKFWMCIELHKVDNHTFYYFLGTEYSAIAQDYLLGSSTYDATFEQACSTSYPYEQRSFIMLVQTDAFANGLLTTKCPDDLLAVFLNFNVTSATTSTASCSGSTLDVCTDRTTMIFGYNDSCSSPAKTTSTNGNYSCLYQTTVGDSSYLGLWNQDVTVDGTNNYRYSCLAFKKQGGTVYATETPNFCTSTTTATVPGPNGVTMVIWDIDITCPDTVPGVPEEPVDITWLYYLIAGLAVLPIAIWFICFFTWCFKKYGCICKHIKCPKVKIPKFKSKSKRLTPKPSPEPDIDVSRGETVERVRFTGPIKQAPNFNMSHLFRPKKPIDDFTMLSAIFLEQNPMSLLEAPNVGPIYKDTLDDYLSRGIRRSYTQISLDSSIYEKKDVN